MRSLRSGVESASTVMVLTIGLIGAAVGARHS